MDILTNNGAVTSYILKLNERNVDTIERETGGSRGNIGEIDYSNDEVFKNYCMEFQQNCCCIIFNIHTGVTEKEHDKYKISQSFWDENGRKKLRSFTNKFNPKIITWQSRIMAKKFEDTIDTIVKNTKQRSGFGLRDVDFCTYNKKTLYTISFIDAIEGYEVKEWGHEFKLNEDYLHLIEDDRIASQIDGYDIRDIDGDKFQRIFNRKQREIDRFSFYNIFKGAAIGFGLNGKTRESLELHNRINLPSMFYNNDGQPEWLAKERRTFGWTNCKYIVWKKKTVKEGSSDRDWLAFSSDDDEEEEEEDELITTNIVINDFIRVPTLPENAVPGDVKNSDHFLNFLSLMERFVAPKSLYEAVYEAYIQLVNSINKEVLADFRRNKANKGARNSKRSLEEQLNFKIQQYKNLPTNPTNPKLVQAGIENQAKHILDVVIWSALLMNIKGKRYIQAVDYEDPSYFYEMLRRVNRTMKQSDLVVQFIHMIFHYDLDAITKVKFDEKKQRYYPTFPLNIFLMKDLFLDNNGMYLNSTQKNNFLKRRDKNIKFGQLKTTIQAKKDRQRAQTKNYGLFLFLTRHSNPTKLINKFFENMSQQMRVKLTELVIFYSNFISSLMFIEDGDSSFAKIPYFLNGGQGALKKAQGIRAYLRNPDIKFPGDDDKNTLKLRFQSALDDIIDQLNSIRQYLLNYSGEDEDSWISTDKLSREELQQYYDDKILDLLEDLKTERNPLKKIEMEYSLQLYQKTLTYFSNIDTMVERDKTIADDIKLGIKMKKKTSLLTAITLSKNIDKYEDEGRKLKSNIKQIKKSQGKKKEEEKQKEAKLKEEEELREAKLKEGAREELEGLTTELNNKYGLNLEDVSGIIEHCRRMIDVVKQATKLSSLRDEINNRLYEMTSLRQWEKDQRDRVIILKRLEKEYKIYSDALDRLQSSNVIGNKIKFKRRDTAKIIQLRSELENVEDRKYQVSKLFDRYDRVVETLSLYTQTLSAAIEYRKIEVNEQMKEAEKELDAIYKFLEQTMKQKKYFDGPISGLEIISRLKKINGEKLYLDYFKDNSLSLESMKLNIEKTRKFQEYDNLVSKRMSGETLAQRKNLRKNNKYLREKNKLEEEYRQLKEKINKQEGLSFDDDDDDDDYELDKLLQELLEMNVEEIRKRYNGFTKARYINELLDREEENKKEKRKEFDYDDNNNNIPRKKKRDKLIDEYEQLKF